MNLRPFKYFCVDAPVYGLNVPADRYMTSGVRFLRTTDVGRDGSLAPEVSGVFLDRKEVPSEYILRDGDLLFSRSGTLGRSLLFREQSTPSTHAGYLVRFRPDKDSYPPYLAYCAQSNLMQDAVGADAIESTIGNFNAEKYANVSLPWWPKATQQAIADYLDRETAQIDALIAAKRRMVELLEERFLVERENIVTGRPGSPVTDYSTSRKPSGVDWLDDLPASWRSYPLKHFFSFSKGKDAQRLTQEYVATHPGPYPVYSGQTVGGGLFGMIDSFDFEMRSPAILITTVGSDRTATSRLVNGRFSLSQNCALIYVRTPSGPDVRFVAGQLVPLFARKKASLPAHLQTSLRIEDLRGFSIVLPRLADVAALADRIEALEVTLQETLSRLTHSITLLQERRQALITAAVTGKLDIPEAA